MGTVVSHIGKIMTPFSVVVCTLNRSDALKQTLTSLLANSELINEIWIMDQSSDSQSEKMILESFPHESRLRYVKLSVKGKSRAANLAARQAKGPYLAFTDDDCQVADDWLPTFHRAFETNRDIGGVFGSIETKDSRFRLFFSSHGTTQIRLNTTTDFFSLQEICGGGNMAFKKETYLSLGGQDEMMGPGAPIPSAEDLDLFYRTLAQHVPLLFDPRARVFHTAKRIQNGADANNVEREYVAGAVAYYLKVWRCGDAAGIRLLYAYFKYRIWFYLQNFRSCGAGYTLWRLCLFPFWFMRSILFYARFPISISERRYQPSEPSL